MSARSDLAQSNASARTVGLRYISDGASGLERARDGDDTFIYRDSKGRVVRNAKTLGRIRSLAIPPAWTQVWICAHPNGHLQATGRDARDRKQYRYHPVWTAARDQGKYDRMVEFGGALPGVRRRVEADLKKPPLSREHVLAIVVKLLERTLIRIGNREYARANNSFGLTTLRVQHVQINGSSIIFHFRAKSGIMQTIELNDGTLARALKKCRKLPGRALFQYLDARGKPQGVDSGDVNAYLKEITGRPFTAKNFRTWAGTVMAAQALCDLPPGGAESTLNRNVLKAVDAASSRLGNTRAVCRKCYVHPAVFDAYRAGVTIAGTMKPAGPRRLYFSLEETAVLNLLRRKWHGSRGEKAAA